MVGTQEPHSPNGQVAPDLLSATPAPKGLVLFGYVIWALVSMFFLLCLVALVIGIFDPESVGIATSARAVFLALVAAVMLFYCAFRLLMFSRRHPASLRAFR